MVESASQTTAVSEIHVEVAYARPDRQAIIPVTVPAGTTAYDAAQASGIVGQFPEIDLETAKMGIFGKAVPKPREQALQGGDRVEIYRPLIADPKEVRKRRAEQARLAKQSD
ncbi:MAG: RnfH family protein [Oceanospirillales bacterium LUC14_002_19_P2]|nr:MAG: RnfH family protein [Oceanospirillales bacterium LUC14_002_19_P2]